MVSHMNSHDKVVPLENVDRMTGNGLAIFQMGLNQEKILPSGIGNLFFLSESTDFFQIKRAIFFIVPNKLIG